MQLVLRAAVLPLALLTLIGSLALATPARADEHTSKPFHGVKANTGTVIHSRQGAVQTLTLSDDFKVPEAPAPHWQIVDSQGNTYLLQRLVVKGDKFNKQITLPGYIRDVAKVQIWCAWAEVLLGEAEFETVQK
jgi:hypothetical protein